MHGACYRLLVSWILFGVRGFCLAVALDDLRGLALVLLSMIQGMGFALALAWSLCGRSLMICGALLWSCSDDPGGGVVVGLLLLDSVGGLALDDSGVGFALALAWILQL